MHLRHGAFIPLPISQGLISFASAASAAGQSTPLVLAVHLTRPEVIKTCLHEIEKSDYEFVWNDVEEKEDPGESISVTFKLTATLLRKSDLTKKDRTSQVSPAGEALLTIQRDSKRLKEGELFFNCHIDYKMDPAKSKVQ